MKLPIELERHWNDQGYIIHEYAKAIDVSNHANGNYICVAICQDNDLAHQVDLFRVEAITHTWHTKAEALKLIKMKAFW
jgi:hypothetical protein